MPFLREATKVGKSLRYDPYEPESRDLTEQIKTLDFYKKYKEEIKNLPVNKILFKTKPSEKANREWIDALKLRGCVNCGINPKNKSLLHFHYRNRSEKSFSIGRSEGMSKSIILAEIEKCDLLCAPCHKKVHRRHGK